MFDATRFVNPDPLPVNTPVVEVMFPVAVREVRVPTLVMFACVGFETVKAVATLPTIVEAGIDDDEPAVIFEIIGKVDVIFDALIWRVEEAPATPEDVK